MSQTTAGILVDLKKFLKSLSKNRVEIDNSTVGTATNLLKSLPASREAVLFYFCQVINESIKKYLSQPFNESPSIKKSSEREESITLICDCLSSLIVWNPKGWAPIISSWSLRLLGQMSSYHSSELRMDHINSGLNDTLQVSFI